MNNDTLKLYPPPPFVPHQAPDPKQPFETNAVTPGIRMEQPPAAPMNMQAALVAILKAVGKKHFLTTQEREELKRLDAEWRELNSQLEATTHQAIRRRFRELLDKGTPEPESMLEERGALLRRSLKDRMRQTTTKAAPIAIAGSRRLAEIAEGVANDLEPVERSEAEQIGFPFMPSPLLRAAKHFAHHGRSFDPYPSARCMPSSLIHFIVE